MRLLIVQDYLRLGGTERTSVFLARHWAKLGHSVRLLTFRPGGPLAAGLHRAGETSNAPAGSPDWQALQPFDARMSLWAPGLVAAAAAFSPHAVLLMGTEAQAHGARLAKALPQARVVGSLRTGRVLPGRCLRALRQLERILANSQAGAAAAASLGVSPDRIRVVRNPCLLTPWCGAEAARARAELRAADACGEQTTVLLYLGSLSSRKDPLSLLRRCARLPASTPWKLWLVGDGPLRAAAGRTARRLGLSARVRFWGAQSDPRPWLAGADLVVSASRGEGLPNALVEAQMAGLPVVADAVGGTAECLDPGRSGFTVAPGDAEAWCARVQQLASDASMRREQSAAARQHALAEFDPATQAGRMLAELLPA